MHFCSRKYANPFPEVSTWMWKPISDNRSITAWQRVLFPKPRPLTMNRHVRFAVTKEFTRLMIANSTGDDPLLELNQTKMTLA